MMKRYILSIVLGFFAMTNFSFGQVEIIFESENANTNGTVDIDIMANGFTDISVLQFSAGWDSLVMTFNSVVFTNPDLPDLMPSSIGSPQGSANVDEGQFSFSYGNPVGNGNVPDGATLFTVRFDIVGEECDETDIVLTDDPTEIDAYDAAFEQLTVSSQPGTIMINGADCGGGGGDDLTFTAAMVTVEPGEMFCVPITVENFIEIQTGTGTILWDPEVVSYTGLANIALAGLGGMLNETNTDNGHSICLQRYHFGFAVDRLDFGSFSLQAKHSRNRRPVEIGVHNADFGSQSAKTKGQIGRDSRFADAAFT